MLGKTFEGSFGDKRLDDRGNDIVKSLFIRGSHSVRQFSENSADLKGNYRFFENEQTSEEAIVKGISRRCGAAVRGKAVLSIQDTSEINLYNHKSRIKKDESIGSTNAPINGLGFMVHPSIVVDASTCFPYGYGYVHFYNRDLERVKTRDKHHYKRLPIEEKESNKWPLSCQAAKESLKDASMVIIVQDREGDIYEQFASVPDERTHLLIRAKSNRTLPEGGKLFDKLALSSSAGEYSVDIEGDKRKKQKKRTAKIEVRFTEVEIKNSSRTAKNIAPKLKLYYVEAREVGKSSKQGGILWRLLTTVPVSTFQDALMIIEWYSWRWMIEEVFRILKKEGFDIEASELGSGTSVKKLCLLTLDAILKIFQMRIAYEEDEGEGLDANICFEKPEIELLEKQSKKLEGKTEKQKNPYKASSLRFATWVIARLGGWKGYTSQRKPGITTLWIGIKKFYDTYSGFIIGKDVSTR